MAKSNAVKSSQATVDGELAPKPPVPVPTSAPARFELIDLAKLEESPFNPRKHFDAAKLEELAESVRAKGVLEPLLVRPVQMQGNRAVRFQVVAGARRFRAAQKAILEQVPCLVRELSDVEALEIATIENVQRDDISAVDEGMAYRELMKLGRTVEELVEKTGRSRTIVFSRMKLAGLEGAPRKALDEGKLTASVAELLARLPTVAMQEAAFTKLTKEAHYRYVAGGDYSSNRKDLSGVPVFHAREILDAEFRLVLKKAPFDVKDEQLVAGAGACEACPKRTGADKALFPGVKEDHCLDQPCWSSKASAATRLLKKEVLEHGKELVRINKLTDQYSPGKLAKPVAEKFSRPGELVDGKHTWKQLLGGETPTVVALDKENGTHNLVDKKKAMELLEAKDPKKAAALKKVMEEPKVDDWRKRQDEQRKKHAAASAAAGVVKGKALSAVTKLETALDLWITGLASEGWDWERTLKAAGLPAKSRPEKLKPADKVRLLVGQAFNRRHDAVVGQAAKLVKMDVKALTKKALEAEPGKCFVCGCTAEKPCGEYCKEDFTCEPKSITCAACQGEED